MKFTVNGMKWSMKFTDKDLDEQREDMYMGLTKFIDQEILIRKGMSRRLTRMTVIHELCHCFLFSYGITTGAYDEEQLCKFVAANIDQIIDLTDEFLSK